MKLYVKSQHKMHNRVKQQSKGSGYYANFNLCTLLNQYKALDLKNRYEWHFNQNLCTKHFTLIIRQILDA